MSLYKDLLAKKETMAVVGLGYVGMPIAVEFAKYLNVIGYDLNTSKIQLYQSGIDPTNEVGNNLIKQTTMDFTSNKEDLKKAKFFIIAVPTPINSDKTPDLTPVEEASRIVGQSISKGSIIVYESTVYPGVTEDICATILENISGLKCGVDFKIGYSPERINPGDKIHRLTNIKKIVSGMDDQTLKEIKNTYDIIIEAGTHPVSSIKTAEAIKVVENSQRDINIAFMNELAMVFDRMNIDTAEVIEGMNTKWNALGFRPGLVGGHCIGVDPYYFTYEAEKLGFHSQIILSGRKVNDGMGTFIADAAIKEMVKSGLAPQKSNVAILGITFKENCNDIRNSKVIDIVNRLKEYNINPIIVDPLADEHEVNREYNLKLTTIDQAKDLDCLILAVAHDDYKNMSVPMFKAMFKNSNRVKIIIDVKSIINVKDLDNDISCWRL